MKKISLLLGGVLSFYLAYLTGSGKILEFVHFADPLNEMAFFVLAITMGTGCFMCSKEC
jgi:hypothetical protein